MATAVPTVALWLSPATLVMAAGAPTWPVALKVTVPRAWVAVRVFVPGALPIVQETEAFPSAWVVAVAAPTEPPPAVTAKATDCPASGFPKASFTDTTTGLARACPTGPAWLSPDTLAKAAGAPAWVVTETVAERPPAVAVRVCVPTVVPSVQEVDAVPVDPVVAEAGLTVPAFAENATDVPANGCPSEPVTRNSTVTEAPTGCCPGVVTAVTEATVTGGGLFPPSSMSVGESLPPHEPARTRAPIRAKERSVRDRAPFMQISGRGKKTRQPGARGGPASSPGNHKHKLPCPGTIASPTMGKAVHRRPFILPSPSCPPT